MFGEESVNDNVQKSLKWLAVAAALLATISLLLLYENYRVDTRAAWQKVQTPYDTYEEFYDALILSSARIYLGKLNFWPVTHFSDSLKAKHHEVLISLNAKVPADDAERIYHEWLYEYVEDHFLDTKPEIAQSVQRNLLLYKKLAINSAKNQWIDGQVKVSASYTILDDIIFRIKESQLSLSSDDYYLLLQYGITQMLQLDAGLFRYNSYLPYTGKTTEHRNLIPLKFAGQLSGIFVSFKNVPSLCSHIAELHPTQFIQKSREIITYSENLDLRQTEQREAREKFINHLTQNLEAVQQMINQCERRAP